jgi:hypothetical protein
MNRLFKQTIKEERPELVRYRYTGRIADHTVAGEMELPNASWGPEAGLRRLYSELHEGCGLSFEEMEESSSVEWQQAA